MSRADFTAARDLFMSVMDRHDGKPDGIHPDHKTALRDRLTSYQEAVVSVQSDVFTRTLMPPDCFPKIEE
jgi:hypothetical protein